MDVYGQTRKQIIQLLWDSNAEDITVTQENITILCRSKVDKICTQINLDFSTILRSLQEVDCSDADNNSAQWRYVCIHFYLLRQLQQSLKIDDILSVQESNKLRDVFRNICAMGICCNLQPNLPFYKKINDDELTAVKDAELIRYRRLKNTTNSLINYTKCPQLRGLIIPNYLKVILVSLYQIVYCPLKKPSEICGKEKFVMTNDIYDGLLRDREYFRQHFEYLKTDIYTPIYVRETMLLVNNNTPQWFKNSVSSVLTIILRSKNGVQSIALALLDGTTNDSTKTWNALEVIAKLVLSCKTSPDFCENICQQVIDLLSQNDVTTDTSSLFERIFVVCCKKLYATDSKLCETTFLSRIISLFQRLALKNGFIDGENITEFVKQVVRICQACFLENSADSPALPVRLLNPIAVILFRLYMLTLGSSLKVVNKELHSLLVKYLEQCEKKKIFSVFDVCLFGIGQESYSDIKEMELILESSNLTVRHTECFEKYAVEECGDAISKLTHDSPKLLRTLFSYLLNCLIARDKYFKNNKTDLLLCDETSEYLTESIKRNLVVFQLLSTLAEDKIIQKHISNKPTEIIEYINEALTKTIDTDTHKTTEYESSGFQAIFTVVMVLQALVNSSLKENLKLYESLIHPLKVIQRDCSSEELKHLVTHILNCLTGQSVPNIKVAGKEVTEVDKAIEDVCDPLLPVRGHGLMTLTKLIEKRDKHVMERKQYILNIFQQNLKNEDSYIYLSAINGLAALCDIFPDIVLNTLAEEYSDFSKKSNEDGHEVRMKLGEILVKVTKLLGEMAPKYKSLLLNTFLVGTKDDDHFIRASSLSNLGEVCRVLGYKLGSVVTEVLVCIEAIIDTDKAIEARRAAVTVLRQLFAGLEKETVAFLKDDILPIYRKLKHIYYNDADDVMRLQAQLALEELNENMRAFVFPKLELNDEKKIFLLN